MLTTLLLMVGGVMALVLILLAVVVAGIKQEPPAEELSTDRPVSSQRWFGACSVYMSASQTSLQPLTKIAENRA